MRSVLKEPGLRKTSTGVQGVFQIKLFDVLDVVRNLSEEKGCTISQLSLAWVIGRPAVTSAIIGPRNLEQLEDNLKAAEVQLNEKDDERIDEVSKPGEFLSSFYEADLGPSKYK